MQSEEFIDCEPLDPTFNEDIAGKRFYSSLREPDDIGENFAVAQLLAIFEDQDNDDGVEIEVRWFLKPFEIDILRRRKVKVLPNEVFESTVVDDIPAGSIVSTVTVEDHSVTADDARPSPSPVKKRRRQVDTSPVRTDSSGASVQITSFICRYLCSDTLDTLIPIRTSDMSTRGVAYSQYSEAYSAERRMAGETSAEQTRENKDIYARAISQLHVSVLPTELPCRQDEQARVYNFLKNAIGGTQAGASAVKIFANTAGSVGPRPLYISGMPGTGKTATVHAAVNMLQTEVQKGLVNSFDFIEINALRIPSPSDAYTVLWRGISGEHCAHRTAQAKLKAYFSSEDNTRKEKRSYIICLLDELDYLVTSSESVVYNFFQWPHDPHANLVIIGIANTMDLPERLSKRSLSRMGGQQMTRIAFAAYTHDQIFAILSNRLSTLDGVFDKKSLELTARKAAAAAGDLRSALKICQRAIELHRENLSKTTSCGRLDMSKTSSPLPPVTMAMVTKAAAEYRENPLMAATAYACNLDKAIFIGMCKYSKSTGISEMHIEEIWLRTKDAVAAYGQRAAGGCLEMPPWAVFEQALHRLVSFGLLVLVVNRFKKSHPSARATSTADVSTRSVNIDDALFEPRLIHSDIIAALKDVKDPMCLAAWPSN